MKKHSIFDGPQDITFQDTADVNLDRFIYASGPVVVKKAKQKPPLHKKAK